MKILKANTDTSDTDADVHTLNGRNYLVIPVVALVEGVRHAGNAENPELVLAEAFGRYPQTWDSRPIVVDHPQAVDGSFLSASDPEVLENFQLGYMMNSRVDKGKLLVSAWIDLDHVATTTSEPILSMWERLDAGETVEVSVGAIVYTDPNAEGEYQGKAYKGAWDVVIPDHLAFLSQEVGACSIADGCGTFRTESSGEKADNKPFHLVEALPITLNRSQMKVARTYMADKRSLDKTVRTAELKHIKSGGCDTCKGDCSCTDGEGKELEAAHREETRELLRYRSFAARFCFSDGMYDNDIRSALNASIREVHAEAYLYAYNSTYVVYDVYVPGKGYVLYREEYVSDDDNTVLLAGEPELVTFRTVIVPVTPKATTETLKGKDKKKGGKGGKDDEEDNEANASDDDDEEDEAKTKKKKKLSASDDDHSQEDDMATKDKEAETKPQTMEELLATVGADTDVGKQLSAAIALAATTKATALTKILAAPNNKFTEEQLAAMSPEMLEGMVSLLAEAPAEEGAGSEADRNMSGAPAPQAYGARAGGRAAQQIDTGAPPAPNVFADKTTKAA